MSATLAIEPERKPRSNYAKATVREQALRIDFVIGMIERKLRQEQMKTMFMDRYQASESIWRDTYRNALDTMVARLSRPREEYRVEALATYESIIRDPKTPSVVKVRAQQCIDNLLGLQESTGTGEGRVMQVIEVVVNNHNEAVEFNRIRDSLESQAKLIESKPLTSPVGLDALEQADGQLINW